MAFDWFKKKSIDRVEGGELDIQPENTAPSQAIEHQDRALSALHNEDRREHERKEKLRRFVAKVSTLMERVELLERKVDRLEGRLGIKNETEKRSENN